MYRMTRFAIVALACALPLAAQGQASKAPAPPVPQLQKKPLKQATNARWGTMLESGAQLMREGVETKRITPQERAAIEAELNRLRTVVARAAQDGLSEPEEDQIDNAIAVIYERFAGYMADPERKRRAEVKPRPGLSPVAGAPRPGGKGAKLSQRWTVMLDAAATLAREGEEVRRITSAERKQIDDLIGRNKQLVARAAAGGISEAEEDQVDDQLAQMYRSIAGFMSDPQRKRAALGLKQ